MDEADKFLKNEVKDIEEQRQKAMGDKDFKPFLKIEEGVTELEISKQVPRENKKYAGRMIFRVIKDGEEFDLSIGKTSPLYREIIFGLKDGKTKFKITRIGKGRGDTRYSVQSE